MNIEKRDFDKEAASWDEHPNRVKLARDVADAILKQITLTAGMDALDFGCGTGLLTLHVQPFVRSITGVDSSQGMLDIFKTKIAKREMNNTSALLLDLEDDSRLPGNYHIVLSSMVLHHIKDVKHLFNRLYKQILPAGHLCIADLDLDDGQFHDDNTGVFHFGFDRAALRRIFIAAGFENVSDITAATMAKPTSAGVIREFTIFLMTGQKGSLQS